MLSSPAPSPLSPTTSNGEQREKQILILDSLAQSVRVALLHLPAYQVPQDISSTEHEKLRSRTHIWSREEMPARTGVTLLPLIDEILNEAALSPSDITDVGVLTGPGSFTGLRSIVITAQTFAYTYPHIQLYACPRFLPIAYTAYASYLNLIHNKKIPRHKEATQIYIIILKGVHGNLFVQAYTATPTAAEQSQPEASADSHKKNTPGTCLSPLGDTYEIPKDRLYSSIEERLLPPFSNNNKQKGQENKVTLISEVPLDDVSHAWPFHHCILAGDSHKEVGPSGLLPSLEMIMTCFRDEIQPTFERHPEANLLSPLSQLSPLATHYTKLRPLYIRKGYTQPDSKRI